MEVAAICSKCKESLGFLRSVETQTYDEELGIECEARNEFETEAQNKESSLENMNENSPLEDVKILMKNEDDYSAENQDAESSFEQTEGNGVIDIEDIDLSEQNQQDVSRSNDENIAYAVYRNVVDEAFELDPQMEIGIAAEMDHGSDEIVALTRCFECPSDPKSRWKRATNVTKAANRLKRKSKNCESDDGENMLPSSDDVSCMSGFRRVVISNGRLPILQQNQRLFEGKEESICSKKDTIIEMHEERSNPSNVLNESEFGKNERHAVEQAVTDDGCDKSKERLRRASNVLGPNKKCLQLHEQEEDIQPETDVQLSSTDDTAYNVVLITRSFESEPLSDSKKLARERWARVRIATAASKAVSRLSKSRRGQDDENEQTLCDENADCLHGPFVGSGYRKLSMKTIEEVASFQKKRNRFRKISSSKR